MTASDDIDHARHERSVPLPAFQGLPLRIGWLFRCAGRAVKLSCMIVACARATSTRARERTNFTAGEGGMHTSARPGRACDSPMTPWVRQGGVVAVESCGERVEARNTNVTIMFH